MPTEKLSESEQKALDRVALRGTIERVCCEIEEAADSAEFVGKGESGRRLRMAFRLAWSAYRASL